MHVADAAAHVQAIAGKIDVLAAQADHLASPQARFGHRADHRLGTQRPCAASHERRQFIHREHALVGLAGMGRGRRESHAPCGVLGDLPRVDGSLQEASQRRGGPAHYAHTGATADQR